MPTHPPHAVLQGACKRKPLIWFRLEIPPARADSSNPTVFERVSSVLPSLPQFASWSNDTVYPVSFVFFPGLSSVMSMLVLGLCLPSATESKGIVNGIWVEYMATGVRYCCVYFWSLAVKNRICGKRKIFIVFPGHAFTCSGHLSCSLFIVLMLITAMWQNPITS